MSLRPRPAFLSVFAGLGLLLAVTATTRADEPGLETSVPVSGASRLDWTFVLSNQSVTKPPAEWDQDYDPTRQRYDRFLPPRSTSRGKGAGLPLIVFVSAGEQPAGWSALAPTCRRLGIAFASPYGAGNATPMPQRVRIILDVLDDLRRTQPIDPDQTYLAGFSGGARVACAVTFALPELFGGVMPVCAGGELREEPWLRQRAVDRLSVAFLTGTGDFNRGEVERFRGPLLTDVGVRTRVAVQPGLGHGLPDAKTFQGAVEWLQAGLPQRRQFGQKYPASRLTSEEPADRADAARGLLEEGEQRLKSSKTLYSGLMQLQGVMVRWADLPEAETARRTLLEYEQKSEHPWEADDIAEQRKHLLARARALDAYASGPLPDQYLPQRPAMARAARELWILIRDDAPDARRVNEARERITALEKLLAE